MLSEQTQINLDDKYELKKGRIYVTGTQALVRLPIMQIQRDKELGLNTSAFISGYRGSPLGNYDRSLWNARKFLDNNNIKFSPGLNEDLAATAVWGSQQPGLISKSKKDGIFGIWYGKGPGVDRSGDAFKHANSAGTSPNGGVLVLLGDDHTAKSSTLAHQSEFSMIDAQIPVLNPSNVQELIDFGIYGWALSRFSGLWTALKCVTATVDSSASISIDPLANKIIIPPFDHSDGVHIRWPDDVMKQEERILNIKIPAAHAFVYENNIDKVIWNKGKGKLGIISTGKGYAELREALSILEIDEEKAKSLGVHLYKVGMSWPLEPKKLISFCSDLEEVLVVEEKRPLVESQVREILYNMSNRPSRILGKYNESLDTGLTSTNELNSHDVAKFIGERISTLYKDDFISSKITMLKQKAPEDQDSKNSTQRTPYFCSGCPHNTSTKLPQGSKAMAGIGCHFMAAWMNRDTDLFTHMGAEGANWIGMSEFVEDNHIFQNLGDGTYNHSGILAIRASVAAGVNITYKILYNDAVAMTGGQPVDGSPTPSLISHQLHGEGIKKIAVVTDEPAKYGIGANFSQNVSIHHRSELDSVQRELREWPGVTAIIYDQTCATEKRRRRKRGLMEDIPKRVFINDLICEGCGDCSKASNCISVEPLETEYGRKRKINQSSCNKDFSCLEGFCPSFVSIEGGTPKKINISNKEILPKKVFDSIPYPTFSLPPDYTTNIIVTGIGGTGVVTIGALIGMAAHIENKGISVLDQVGVAQKGGAVTSHIKISNNQENIHSVTVAKNTANLILGCDMVVAASSKVREYMSNNSTTALINDHETPVAASVLNPDFSFEGRRMKNIIEKSVDRTNYINATKISTLVFGDSIGSNMFLTGFGIQKGWIPISPEALERAIELNNIAVKMNIDAFRLGRLAAHDMKYIELNILSNIESSPHSDASKESGFSLDELINNRKSFLKKYQNSAYAKRYTNLVERVRRIENNKALESSELTRAVANYFFKLMAYKDEYEVARLYSDSLFMDKIKSSFDGKARLSFYLAPPLISPKDPTTGKPKKIKFGHSMLFVFKILSKFKFLRGSILDPFGYTRERKIERDLINRYESNINDILNVLSNHNHSIAVQIANIPEQIRGFGHVKEEHLKRAFKREKELIKIIKSPKMDSRAAE